MDCNFTMVSFRPKDELFNQIIADPAFSAIEAHPQSGIYGRTYYPAYWGERYRDFSFAVMWQGRPALVVLCGITDDVLGLHGLPMQIFCRPDIVDRHVLTLAAKAAFAQINRIAVAGGVREVLLRDIASAILPPIGEVALGYEAKASVTLTGMVDLTAGPAVWKHALRKSFHQFVNWGRKNLTIDYVNGASPSLEDFDTYREFHAQIAGRVTRPKESWDIQFAEISRGRGELILAHLDGKLAEGSLFIDGTELTLYMNGVYDRALDKPLAHYMVWHGIERAHGRGLRRFQLGDIHLTDAVDDKRHSVGYFKRGFATHFEASLVWQWCPEGSAGNTEI
jgi:hypothetical protein